MLSMLVWMKKWSVMNEYFLWVKRWLCMTELIKYHVDCGRSMETKESLIHQ